MQNIEEMTKDDPYPDHVEAFKGIVVSRPLDLNIDINDRLHGKSYREAAKVTRFLKKGMVIVPSSL